MGTMPAAAKCSLSTLLTSISIGPKTRRIFESNHWILVLAPPRLKKNLQRQGGKGTHHEEHQERELYVER